MRLVYSVAAVLLFASGAPAQDLVLKGAGASFPAPLYQHWIGLYNEKTGARISYESVGSGEGIRQLLDGEVDFGATDIFLSDEAMPDSDGNVLHLPTCAGAVVVAYNIPEVSGLRLTGEVIADIYLNRIHNWSDPRIQRLNPEMELPDLNIVVLHRSDSSGTTYVFTDYLSKVGADWKLKAGRSKELHWPCGLGLDRNSGVAEFLGRIPGSIGYLEYGYACRQQLPCALIRNRQGHFVSPSQASIKAAADIGIPADTRMMITDSNAEFGYPLSTFTWLIVRSRDGELTGSLEKDRALMSFLYWILTEGQLDFGELYYAPLPDRVVRTARTLLGSIRRQ